MALLAAALFLATPGHAYWYRLEVMGGDASTAYDAGRALDLAFYNSRYGLGVGSTAYEVKYGGWDVPRAAASDASGHFIGSFTPIKAYAALYSFEGPPFFATENVRAWPTIGRVELYGAYSGWAKMYGFNEAFPGDMPGDPRNSVSGSVPARYWDVGVRADLGQVALASLGWFRFDTQASAPFLARTASPTLYGSFSLYLGYATGRSAGGNVFLLAKDLWFKIRGEDALVIKEKK